MSDEKPSTFSVLLFPGAVLGSDGKMRLNVNVFVDPSVFARVSSSESFAWISRTHHDASDGLLARYIPLPSLASLCSLLGKFQPVDVNSTAILDEDGLPNSWRDVSQISIQPIRRYMLPAWRTLVFQASDLVDEMNLPVPGILRDSLKKRPFPAANSYPIDIPLRNKSIFSFDAFGIGCLETRDNVSAQSIESPFQTSFPNGWGVVSDDTQILILPAKTCNFPRPGSIDQQFISDISRLFDSHVLRKVGSYLDLVCASSSASGMPMSSYFHYSPPISSYNSSTLTSNATQSSTSSILSWLSPSLLLLGPPGCGKSMLIQTMCEALKIRLIRVTLPALLSRATKTSDALLNILWRVAQRLSPCVLYFDDLHILFPQSESSESISIVAAFAKLMEEFLRTRPRGVLVIGAAHSLNMIHPLVRSLFEDDVQLDVPTPKARAAALQFHARQMKLGEAIDWSRVSHHCSGFVGADLAALCQLAFLHAQRRFELHKQQSTHSSSSYQDDLGIELPSLQTYVLDSFNFDGIETVPVVQSDFEFVIRRYKPSEMGRDLGVPELVDDDAKNDLSSAATSPVSAAWSNIAGLNDAKQRLEQLVLLPLRHRSLCSRLGIEIPRSILLFGPPGCGKTMIARALAIEARAHFVPLSLADLLKSDVGESEKLVAKIFQRARACAPCIVFLDEVQAVFSKQDANPNMQKVRTQLFFEMDRLALQALPTSVGLGDNEYSHQVISIDSGVLILAATNRPDLIDPSLIRGGRFGQLVHIPSPQPTEREDILRLFGKRMCWSSNVEVSTIATRAAGFSGADLLRLCSDAALISLTRNQLKPLPVEMQDFDEAFSLQSSFKA